MRSFLNVIILFSSKRNLGLYLPIHQVYMPLVLKISFSVSNRRWLCVFDWRYQISFEENVLQHLNLIYSEFDLCGISFSLQSSFKLVTIYSSRLLALERKSFPRKPVFCNFLCNVQNLGARMPEKINSP